MAAAVPTVGKLKVELLTVTSDEVPELEELFSMKHLPVSQAEVSIEIKNTPTAVVNALRRVVMNEIEGLALEVKSGSFSEGTTEKYMLPEFVCQRISFLRLVPSVDRGLVLRLEYTNNTASVQSVYAGDLEIVAGKMPVPAFNPTTEIATVQPGKKLVIDDICVVSGVGKTNAMFNVACRAALKHTDLEQEKPEALQFSDLSGYKTSIFVANPREHLLTATIPAVSSPAEAVEVFVAGCANIVSRLQNIQKSVTREDDKITGRNIQYTVVELAAGLSEGILVIPNETHTIGHLLLRIIYEMHPQISNVSYNISSHEDRLTMSLRDTGDVTTILLRAVEMAINVFSHMQRQIAAKA